MNGANVPELMKKLKMNASAADVEHTAPEQVMNITYLCDRVNRYGSLLVGRNPLRFIGVSTVHITPCRNITVMIMSH